MKGAIKVIFLAITTVVFLTGCGGGGGGGSTAAVTKVGQFKDAYVKGLSYTSGSYVSQVTGTNGSFNYEVGKPIKFFLGGVNLGTVSSAKSVITPIDFVASGSATSVKVGNIVRFLMTLDSDGNPANGITISPKVRAKAASWKQLDFKNATNTSLANFLLAARIADPTGSYVATVPTTVVARIHLVSSLFCPHSGAFEGTYSGRYGSKNIVFIVTPYGGVDGRGYGAPPPIGRGMVASLNGTLINLDKNPTFLAYFSGGNSNFTDYSGQFTSIDNITGKYKSSSSPSYSVADTFSVSRKKLGLTKKAKYRYSGIYIRNASSQHQLPGNYFFEVDAAGAVSGVAYDLSTTNVETLSGTLIGTALNATTSGRATITGTLSAAYVGIVTGGTWRKPGDLDSGTLVSNGGCQL